MTSPLRTALLFAASATLAAVALTGCASTGGGSGSSQTAGAAPSSSAPVNLADCTGVGVVVDTGNLKADGVSTTKCVDAAAPIVAADAVKKAGITTEGTKQYGDQVVCRVNGAPAESTAIAGPNGSAYHETCAGMPAAFAYWAMWVKPKGGAWAYAQEGLATQKLNPGDTLELLFTLNNAPASPTPAP